MKKIKYIIISVIFLFSGISILFAQNSEGKEFWLTFGKMDNYYICETSFLELKIRIVSGSMPTAGKIYFTHLNDSVSFELNEYDIFDHSLTNIQKCAAYNTTMGTSDYSIRIITSEPVTVYAYSRYGYSMESTKVLPITALGKEYYQISYITQLFEDAYAIVATQDSTELYHNGIFVTKLNKGEVYYRTSATDMTGAHITSNHPVAFFTVNQRAQNVFIYNSSNSFFEQMSPVNTWGKTFFVPVSINEKEIVRIVVSQNNTAISPKGGKIRTDVPNAQTDLTNLQAGEFVELEVYLDSAGCYIQADKPVGVCTYLQSIPPDPIFDKRAIPSLCWVPNIKQSISKVQIAPFPIWNNNGFYYGSHFVLVYTPTETKEQTMVSVGNGVPTALSDASWYDNDTANMSFYSMPLTDIFTSYTFSNPKGVIILGYCLSMGGQGATGYYYLAGSAMRTLDAAFYVNDIHYEDLKDTTFCSNHINFRAEIENMGVEMDSLKWYINGIEKYTKLNHLEWDTTLSNGTYKITMWVRFENGDTTSRTGTLKIVSCSANSATFYVNNIPYDNLQDTVFCDKNVNFRAEIEGLNPNAGSLKWYIDEVLESSAQDHLQWSKDLDTGDHKIEMEVLFANNNTETLTCILKMNVFWIKMRNVRY